MKVQFMKKLVPLALIASIAATNVGLTSVAVSAQETAVVQSVEGAPVVEDDVTPITNGGATIGFSFNTADDNDRLTVDTPTTYDSNGKATVDLALNPALSVTGLTKDQLSLRDSSGENEVEGVEIDSLTTTAPKKLTIKVDKKALKDGDLHVYLYYWGETGTGNDAHNEWLTNPETNHAVITGYGDAALTDSNKADFALKEAVSATLEYTKNPDNDNKPNDTDTASFIITLKTAREYENKVPLGKFFIANTNAGTTNMNVTLEAVDGDASKVKVTVPYSKAKTLTDDTVWYWSGNVGDDNTATCLDTTNKITLSVVEKEYIDEDDLTETFGISNDFSAKYEIKEIASTGKYGLYRTLPKTTTTNGVTTVVKDETTKGASYAGQTSALIYEFSAAEIKDLLTKPVSMTEKEVKDAAEKTGATQDEKNLYTTFQTNMKTELAKYFDKAQNITVDEETFAWKKEDSETHKMVGRYTEVYLMYSTFLKDVTAYKTAVDTATASGAIKEAADAALVDWLYTNRSTFFVAKPNGEAYSKIFDASDNDFAYWSDGAGKSLDENEAKTIINEKLTAIKSTYATQLADTTNAAAIVAAQEEPITIATAEVVADKIKSDCTTLAKFDELFTKESTVQTNYASAREWASGVVLAGSDFTIPAQLDGKKFMWVMESYDPIKKKYTSNKANAKMYGQGLSTAKATKGQLNGEYAAKNDKRYGTSIEICNTTIPAKNNKFNGDVILKLVAPDYSVNKPTEKVYAQTEFFVESAAAEKWKTDSITAGNGITVAEVASTDASFETGSHKTYKLTVPVNKSQKLNFAIDGVEAGVSYVADTHGAFQIKDNTIKGLQAGTGTVTVKALVKTKADSDASKIIKLIVDVVDDFSSKGGTRVNTKNISIYPGAEQVVYLGTTSATKIGDNYTFKLDGLDEAYEVGHYNSDGNFVAYEGGVIRSSEAVIRVKEGKQLPTAKNNVTVKLYKNDGTTAVTCKAEAKLTIKPITAPTNVKNLKETLKKLNSEGVIEVNVPVGSAYNLGVSVNPVTANSKMEVIKGVGSHLNAANEAVLDEAFVPIEVADMDALEGLKETNREAYDEIKAIMLTLYQNGDTTKTEPAPATSGSSGASEYNSFANNLQSAVTQYNTANANPVDIEQLSVAGDVVTPGVEGTYYVQYKAVGNANAVSKIYKINAYTPGGGITLETQNQQSGYSIVGGSLIRNEARLTNGKNVFYGGGAPLNLHFINSEPIDWKCNNAAAIGIDDYDSDGREISLYLNKAGSWNITGTARYSKSKIVFKVNVAGDTAQFTGDTVPDAQLINVPTTMQVKDKKNVFIHEPAIGYAAKTITFTSSDATVASVSGTGLVTAKKAGKFKITAKGTTADNKTFTVTSDDITVNPLTPTCTKLTVPTGATNNEEFKVTAAFKNVKVGDKGDAEIVWQTSTNGESWANATLNKNKLKLSTDGNNYVRVLVMAKGKTAPTDNTTMTDVLYKSEAKNVKVYAAAQKISKVATSQKGDKDAAAAIKALAKAKYDAEKKPTAGAGYGTYYIPVFATAAVDNTTITAAAAGDIEWTVDNTNLAEVETIDSPTPITVSTDLTNKEQNAIAKSANAAYALIKITTTAAAKTNGWTGKVVITGVTKNSNKKVTVTLDLNGADRVLDDAYAPQAIEATQTGNSATLSKVVAMKATEKSFTAEEELAKVKTVKKDKTFTDWKYVIVNTDTSPKKENVVGVEKTATAAAASYTKIKNLVVGTISSTTGEATVTFDTDGLPAGNYYLAKAKITYKVDKAYAEKTDTTAEVPAEYSVKDIASISIASKRPMVVGTATAKPVTNVEWVSGCNSPKLDFGTVELITPTSSGMTAGTKYCEEVKYYLLLESVNGKAASDGNYHVRALGNNGTVADADHLYLSSTLYDNASITSANYVLVAKKKMSVARNEAAFESEGWNNEFVVLGTKAVKITKANATNVQFNNADEATATVNATGHTYDSSKTYTVKKAIDGQTYADVTVTNGGDGTLTLKYNGSLTDQDSNENQTVNIYCGDERVAGPIRIKIVAAPSGE